jgi:hypothetical protein
MAGRGLGGSGLGGSGLAVIVTMGIMGKGRHAKGNSRQNRGSNNLPHRSFSFISVDRQQSRPQARMQTSDCCGCPAW